jgi:hypothetical protein
MRPSTRVYFSIPKRIIVVLKGLARLAFARKLIIKSVACAGVLSAKALIVGTIFELLKMGEEKGHPFALVARVCMRKDKRPTFTSSIDFLRVSYGGSVFIEDAHGVVLVGRTALDKVPVLIPLI